MIIHGYLMLVTTPKANLHRYKTSVVFAMCRETPSWLTWYLNLYKTSPNGNIFCLTGSLWEESIGHQWIPPIKASEAELWWFLWSAPEKKCWAINRDAGVVRRHHPHDGITVMFSISCTMHFLYLEVPICQRTQKRWPIARP